MRKLIFLATLLIAATLAAETVEGDTLGPEVSKIGDRELKWEDGAHDFFVMFKSLLSRQFDTASSQTNMQPDTCLDSSTFTLQDFNIPPDAYITDAFLIWNGAVALEALDAATDNTVTLSFTGVGGASLEREVTAGEAQLLGGEKGFPFEGTRLLRQIVNEDHTGYVDSELAYFTYRVDITDFFAELHAKGRELGLADGASLAGDYTVSGLDCTNEDAYLSNLTMVSSWAIILVFASEEIAPKNLYLYDGFYRYYHKSSVIDITGFRFPDKPSIRLTLMVNEGDYKLVNTNAAAGGSLVPESLRIRGAGEDYEDIFNSCNPSDQSILYGTRNTPFYYTEIFNSISSEFGFDATSGETCVGGTPPTIFLDQMEYAIDVDTFYIDASSNKWGAHFFEGVDHISLRIGANQDAVLTNFLILSHDVKEEGPTEDADAIGNDDEIFDSDNYNYDGPPNNDNTTLQDEDSSIDSEYPQEDADTVTTTPSAGCSCSLM